MNRTIIAAAAASTIAFAGFAAPASAQEYYTGETTDLVAYTDMVDPQDEEALAVAPTGTLTEYEAATATNAGETAGAVIGALVGLGSLAALFAAFAGGLAA